MKALAKDRDERYQTAKDLLIDLKRLKQKLVVDAEIERSAPLELAAEGGEAKSTDGRVVSTAPGVAAQTEVAGARTNSSAEYIISEIRRHKRSLTAALAVLLLAAAVSIFSVGLKLPHRGQLLLMRGHLLGRRLTYRIYPMPSSLLG